MVIHLDVITYLLHPYVYFKYQYSFSTNQVKLAGRSVCGVMRRTEHKATWSQSVRPKRTFKR